MINTDTIILQTDEEDCYVRSLVENLARRKRTPLEWFKDIESLVERGNSVMEISKKTGLSHTYVSGVLQLLKQGEVRLLNAVESGKIPLSTAMSISQSADEDLQAVLQDAYEVGALRGRKLLDVKKLLERRKRHGKDFGNVSKKPKSPKTAEEALKVYCEQIEQQKILVKRAELCHRHLTVMIEGIKTLIKDEHFITLLRAEKLLSIPACIAEKIELNESTL